MSVEEEEFDAETAKTICINYIEQSFTFINAKKVIDSLWQFAETVQESLVTPINYTFYINLIMHLAGALERVIRNDTLTVPERELEHLPNEPLYPVVLKAVAELERTFKISLPPLEIYYIVQLINNAQANQAEIDEFDTLD